MKIVMASATIAAMLLVAHAARAQEGHACPMGAAAATPVRVQSGPSALTPEQVQQLLAGEGMGQAKAAEQTGYPGPKHVLELADALKLQPAQRTAMTGSFDRMNADARRLGTQIVQAERDLYAAFQTGNMTAEQTERLTMRIGHLQANLRAVHLRAHLEARSVLTSEQTAEYVQRRTHAH